MRPPRPAEKIDPCEAGLLELLLRHPGALAAGSRGDRRRAVRQPAVPANLRDLLPAGRTRTSSPTFDRLMLEFDDPAMKSLLVELDEQGQCQGQAAWAIPPALLEELIEDSRQKEARKAAPRAERRRCAKDGWTTSQADDLLKQIVQQERSRQGISEPTDG